MECFISLSKAAVFCSKWPFKFRFADFKSLLRFPRNLRQPSSSVDWKRSSGAVKLPRKPTTAIEFYIAENYADTKASNKSLHCSKIRPLLIQRWQTLTPSQREPYLKLKENSVRKYQAELSQLNLPPRPLNSFSLFISRTHSELAVKYPAASPRRLTALAAAEWRSLSPNQKSVFQAESSASRIRYLEAMKSVPEDVKQLIRDRYFAKSDRKWLHFQKAQKQTTPYRRAEIEQLQRDYGKPKSPATPFTAYCAQVRREEGSTNGMNCAQFSLFSRSKWATLSADERAENRRLYDAEYAKHKQLLSAWKRRMVESGHRDLIPVLSSRCRQSDRRRKQRLRSYQKEVEAKMEELRQQLPLPT